MSTQYQQLLSRLLAVNLHGGIKLGLDNCHRLDQALGCPSQAFPSVHVAGSNGKGSVVTKVAAALQRKGLRIGLYTSPHIACFRERIQINGEMISEEKVCHYLEKLFSITEDEGIPATFFEITTLMALAYFADENIDIAIIETGLGGRLDATNIVRSKISVITSISLEHTEILGNTLEEIAKEKAGIIKSKIPIIIGPRVPVDIVEQVAKQNQSPFHQVKGTFTDFHAENNAIAKKVLETLNLDSLSIERGLNALPPCRLETLVRQQKTIILDVAHNPDGLTSLMQALSQRFPERPFRFIIGLSKNKDIHACLNVIKDRGQYFHLVEGSNGRAISKEALYDQFVSLKVDHSRLFCEQNIPQAISTALSQGDKKEIIVICGTFFIMAAARAALGFHEPQDHIEMNER